MSLTPKGMVVYLSNHKSLYAVNYTQYFIHTFTLLLEAVEICIAHTVMCVSTQR